MQNFSTCAHGELRENIDEMVERTREAAVVATESGGSATTGDETAATTGDRRNVRPGQPLGDAQPLACRGEMTTLSSQSLAPIQKVRD